MQSHNKRTPLESIPGYEIPNLVFEFPARVQRR